MGIRARALHSSTNTQIMPMKARLIVPAVISRVTAISRTELITSLILSMASNTASIRCTGPIRLLIVYTPSWPGRPPSDRRAARPCTCRTPASQLLELLLELADLGDDLLALFAGIGQPRRPDLLLHRGSDLLARVGLGHEGLDFAGEQQLLQDDRVVAELEHLRFHGGFLHDPQEHSLAVGRQRVQRLP